MFRCFVSFTAVLHSCANIFEAVTKHKQYKSMLKFLETEHAKTEDHYSIHGAPQQAIWVTLQKTINDSLVKHTLFSKLPLDAALSKVVHTLNLCCSSDGHQSCTPLQYGMSECRMILSGKELVVGVPLDEAKALSTQISHFQRLNGNELSTFLESSPNFAMVLAPGHMAVLPSGYLYRFYRPSATVALRWSFAPPMWKDETKRVHLTVSSSLESFPGLSKTKYADILRALEHS